MFQGKKLLPTILTLGGAPLVFACLLWLSTPVPEEKEPVPVVRAVIHNPSTDVFGEVDRHVEAYAIFRWSGVRLKRRPQEELRPQGDELRPRRRPQPERPEHELWRFASDTDYVSVCQQSERLCLALALYHEDRRLLPPEVGADEGFDPWGDLAHRQRAIAHVVLNRVACGVALEPNACRGATVVEVLTQRNQFSFAWDKKPIVPSLADPNDARAFALAWEIAGEALEGALGPDFTGGALFYHAKYVSPRWASAFVPAGRAGKHIFFRVRAG